MNDKATAETARIRSALICLPLIVDEQGERIKEAVGEPGASIAPGIRGYVRGPRPIRIPIRGTR